MKISVSINATDILNTKGDILEEIFARHKLFKNRKNLKVIFSSLQKENIQGFELVLSTKTKKSDINFIKNILKKYNLPVLSIHQPISKIFNLSLEEIEKIMQVARIFGAKIAVLHTCSIDANNFNFIKHLKKMEEKYAIKIGLENNPKNIFFHFRKYCWQEEKFIKFTNKTNFCINFDTTHCGSSKINIIDFFKKHKSKIINIHLSDFRNGFFKKEHLSLGKGDLLIKEFINTLKFEKYAGLVTLEIDDSVDEIINSIKFIR